MCLQQPAMVDTTPIKTVYNILEEDLGISIWTSESRLKTTRVSKECTFIHSSDFRAQTYVLGHFLFGDLRTSKNLPLYFLQASGNVVDDTHPFDIIQTMLHLMTCANLNLEIMGEPSVFRDSGSLYLWGTDHHKQIMHYPIKLLDVRAKEVCSSLIANGKFNSNSVDTLTNSLIIHQFEMNEQLQLVYNHWKPLILSLFLWHLRNDINHIKKYRDVTREIEQMIHLMCRHGLEKPLDDDGEKYSSNGFFSHKLPGENEKDPMYQLSVRKRFPPEIPKIEGNYDIVVNGKRLSRKRKSPNISIRRIYGLEAHILSSCWDISKETSVKDLVYRVYPLLVGHIYPRAFTFRLGKHPPELEEEAKKAEMEMLRKQERLMENVGLFRGEIYYPY